MGPNLRLKIDRNPAKIYLNSDNPQILTLHTHTLKLEILEEFLVKLKSQLVLETHRQADKVKRVKILGGGSSKIKLIESSLLVLSVGELR